MEPLHVSVYRLFPPQPTFSLVPRCCQLLSDIRRDISAHQLSPAVPCPVAQTFAHAHAHAHAGERVLRLSELLISPGASSVPYHFLTLLHMLILSSCRSLSCLLCLLNYYIVLRDPVRMTLSRETFPRHLFIIYSTTIYYLLCGKNSVWCGRYHGKQK